MASDIASRYDELHEFEYDKVSDITAKHLQLVPTDLLVDVGAGTGGITHLLWKKAGSYFSTALHVVKYLPGLTCAVFVKRALQLRLM